MRVNIKARIPMHLYQEFHTLPLVLTIETAHGLAARCEHRTTAAELMWTLDQKTDINAGLLDRFRQKLRLIEEANLSDVEVSDEVLDMFRLVLQLLIQYLCQPQAGQSELPVNHGPLPLIVGLADLSLRLHPRLLGQLQ